MVNSDVTMRDIYLARQRVAEIALRTPLIDSPTLSERSNTPAYMKLESLQRTGSFKIRGATNKLFSLSEEQKERGVITVSSGNHGRAVSYVAKQLGIHAVVCISERVPSNKVNAMRRLGAEVVVHGASYDEADRKARALQKERELTMIDPFDDPYVIAGQGTIGLEMLEDLPGLGTVVVPLSGGGLISGIALALKSANPAIRVIGVSMERAPVMVHSLRAGKLIEMEEEETIADALAGGIGADNRYTFRMVQELVDETVLVSEEEIAQAMAFALDQHRLVVEGGGAVGIAALMQGKVAAGDGETVVVVSGANVNLDLLVRIVQQHV